jgi:soluble lytic murein transglycosylase-like protein
MAEGRGGHFEGPRSQAKPLVHRRHTPMSAQEKVARALGAGALAASIIKASADPIHVPSTAEAQTAQVQTFAQPEIKQAPVSAIEPFDVVGKRASEYIPAQGKIYEQMTQLKYNSKGEVMKDYKDMVEFIRNNKDLITQEAIDNGIAPELAMAIAFTEKGALANNVSSVDAVGVYQLRVEAARDAGLFIGKDKDGNFVDERYDPVKNIKGGIKHLAGQIRLFDNNQQFGVMAYHDGATTDAWIVWEWAKAHGKNQTLPKPDDKSMSFQKYGQFIRMNGLSPEKLLTDSKVKKYIEDHPYLTKENFIYPYRVAASIALLAEAKIVHIPVEITPPIPKGTSYYKKS